MQEGYDYIKLSLTKSFSLSLKFIFLKYLVHTLTHCSHTRHTELWAFAKFLPEGPLADTGDSAVCLASLAVWIGTCRVDRIE